MQAAANVLGDSAAQASLEAPIAFGDVKQYGGILALDYPLSGAAITKFDDFRSTPASNPCDAPSIALTLPAKPVSSGTLPIGKTSGFKALKIETLTAFRLR
jgi:hypothetical protein